MVILWVSGTVRESKNKQTALPIVSTRCLWCDDEFAAKTVVTRTVSVCFRLRDVQGGHKK